MNWLISKLLGLLAMVGALLWGKRQADKRREAEARAKAAERTAELTAERVERHEKIDRMSDEEIATCLRRGGSSRK
ncbi:MAG: hypothetical protein N3E40_00110 [Dehalococcoidia bacterium]|nr:hypothetical protein [Dehalococcoidia bacterium]